jgi:hypothetical protein
VGHLDNSHFRCSESIDLGVLQQAGDRAGSFDVNLAQAALPDLDRYLKLRSM